MRKSILSRYCIIFADHDSYYVIYVMRQGGKKISSKEMGENPLFSHLFFSSPFPFTGKKNMTSLESYSYKSNTKVGKIGLCPISKLVVNKSLKRTFTIFFQNFNDIIQTIIFQSIEMCNQTKIE